MPNADSAFDNELRAVARELERAKQPRGNGEKANTKTILDDCVTRLQALQTTLNASSEGAACSLL